MYVLTALKINNAISILLKFKSKRSQCTENDTIKVNTLKSMFAVRLNCILAIFRSVLAGNLEIKFFL